ncbi:hypothetical protein OI25_6169 [Paraburkholderia fungorum]|uniref:DUF2062 domain-containing protein n=1 Tax=Paraburkholderia fungorum TaxID=134537 RepID=A0AAU8TA75_9BURK|nr:hypothetical protein OI25_6169 [Paraburkholderia fungorum]
MARMIGTVRTVDACFAKVTKVPPARIRDVIVRWTKNFLLLPVFVVGTAYAVIYVASILIYGYFKGRLSH